MKLLKNKKGAWFAPFLNPQAIMAIALVVVFIFGGSGVIKFLFSDKIHLIFGALLVLFFVISRRRR